MGKYTIEASVSKLKVESNGKTSFHLTGTEGYCVKHKEETHDKNEGVDVSYNIFFIESKDKAILIPEKEEFKLEKIAPRIFQIISMAAVNKSKAKFELEISEDNKVIKEIKSIEMM